MLAPVAGLLPMLCLLAAAGAPARAVFTIPLHEQAAWRLDNGRGFGNASVEGFSLPAAALQLLQREGIIGDPLYRWAGSHPAAGGIHCEHGCASTHLRCVCTCPLHTRRSNPRSSQPPLRQPRLPARFNELEQRWAAWDNWTFSLEFQAPPELLAEPAVELVCEGLDTGAWGAPCFLDAPAPARTSICVAPEDVFDAWEVQSVCMAMQKAAA